VHVNEGGVVLFCRGSHGQRGATATVLPTVQLAQFLWTEELARWRKARKPARIAGNVIVVADAASTSTGPPGSFPKAVAKVIADFTTR
jgi:hypothetical protein